MKTFTLSVVTIAGHRALLAILVRNLVDNAVRYGGPGAVRVDVARDDRGARLVVTDEGPGVPAAERAALGQRFRRLAGSGQAGTGLGLSIVKRIAELHRASVCFADGPRGRGLSVTVEFPPE